MHIFKKKPRWKLNNNHLEIKGGMTHEESDSLRKFVTLQILAQQKIKNKHILDTLKTYECTCESSDRCICECVKNTIKLIEDNNHWLKNG